MPSLKTARLEAALSQNALARKSGVSRDTIAKAEKPEPIRDDLAAALVDAANAELVRAGKRTYKLDDLTNEV